MSESQNVICTEDFPNPEADEHPDAYYEGDCQYCSYLYCPNCDNVVK